MATKSRIQFNQSGSNYAAAHGNPGGAAGHSRFSTSYYPLEDSIFAGVAVISVRVIRTDHLMAMGASDPVSFEIRNLIVGIPAGNDA